MLVAAEDELHRIMPRLRDAARPLLPAAYLLLGRAKAARGDSAGARRAWRGALRYGRGTPIADQVQAPSLPSLARSIPGRGAGKRKPPFRHESQ